MQREYENSFKINGKETTTGTQGPSGGRRCARGKKAKKKYSRHARPPYTYLAAITLVTQADPDKRLRLSQIIKEIQLPLPFAIHLRAQGMEKTHSYSWGHAKPPYTYLAVITLVTQADPDKQLRLSQIIKEIQLPLPFFRNNTRKGGV
ncbi:UNVERIFIED_CONTAM: hypothetical protein K2H54_036070 [Gekko kuhli]